MADEFFYAIERWQENISRFPDRDIDTPGNLGWITHYYRENGWNVAELRAHMFNEFAPLYGAWGTEGMVGLYAALLSKRDVNTKMRAANDDEPDHRADAGRLWASLREPQEREGWCARWRPPTFGPAKASPFALIASKLPRVHTRLYEANLIALLTTGNPSPFV